METNPDVTRLRAAREEVQSFLEKRNRWSRLLFIAAAICEIFFFADILWFMDFSNDTHLLIFFGFLFVYCPVIILVFRNSIRIDQLYYRLVDELKYTRDPR